MSLFDPHRLYKNLLRTHGPQGWWPIDGVYKRRARLTPAQRFEIMVGAILTQNTAWANVEKALANLRVARVMSPQLMLKTPSARLATLIRPSGYFRQKTKKLKIISRWLTQRFPPPSKKGEGWGGGWRKQPTDVLRRELVSLWGIGPETADSILLYAFGRPVFVVDTYTLRLCRAHGRHFKTYDACQRFFESHLPRNVRLFSEFHALIVRAGKKLPTGTRVLRSPVV